MDYKIFKRGEGDDQYLYIREEIGEAPIGICLNSLNGFGRQFAHKVAITCTEVAIYLTKKHLSAKKRAKYYLPTKDDSNTTIKGVHKSFNPFKKIEYDKKEIKRNKDIIYKYLENNSLLDD